MNVTHLDNFMIAYATNIVAVLSKTSFVAIFLLSYRLVNPVVVAPTVAAVGLAYFSYGFPHAGNCIEISIPLILLVLIFVLVRKFLNHIIVGKISLSHQYIFLLLYILATFYIVASLCFSMSICC